MMIEMELYRLSYEKFPLPEDVLKFLARYFEEHDTGDNGIIAHMDDAAVKDMADTVFADISEEEQGFIIKKLIGWWLFEFSERERNEGIDIQILTGG
jgi:hypothetical protein